VNLKINALKFLSEEQKEREKMKSDKSLRDSGRQNTNIYIVGFSGEQREKWTESL
jgi:hypothetical protein